MTEARDQTRPDESDDPADAVRANNELWDEWTRIHATSAFYDLEGFKRGGIRLADYEVERSATSTGSTSSTSSATSASTRCHGRGSAPG